MEIFEFKQELSDHEFIITTVIPQKAVTLFKIIGETSLKHLKNGKYKSIIFCPGWCGSVNRVPACEPEGHQFNSQSGHMPGLQTTSPVGGVQETTDQCISGTSMFLSLSFSFPSPLSQKINKIFFKKYYFLEIIFNSSQR